MGQPRPWTVEEAAHKQLAGGEPSCWWVSDSRSDGLGARGPRTGAASTSRQPALPARGVERGRERDEDGATDWQPVGKRRRRCQGTAWRAKAPREPENSFGEKRGARNGGVYSEAGGAEGIEERGRGRAAGWAPAAAWGGAARREGGVGPCGRLPVRSHNSVSLTAQIKDFVNYRRRLRRAD